jgi:O-antigen/teichoic acid export membrane protein
MVRAGWSLYALAVGWFISQILTTPLYAYRLFTRYPTLLPRRLPPMVWSAARTQLGKGFWINVAQVAQLLMGNTDLLIIGRFLGPAAVVPYSCTGKLYGVLGNQVNILMQTAEPALCELKAGESRARIFQVLVALSQGVLTFTGLIFVVVLVVNHWFVDWWVTERQYGGYTLTLVLLITMVVRHWTAITAYSVFCFGHQRRISLTNLSDGLVTAASAAMFVLLWGVVGAPLGSLVGACLVSLPLNFKRIADDVGVTVPQMVIAMVRGWIWRFALAVTVVAWVAAHWSPKNLPEAAGASIAIAALYGLIMLPNVLRAPLGNYIRPLASSFRAKYLALQLRFSS